TGRPLVAYIGYTFAALNSNVEIVHPTREITYARLVQSPLIGERHIHCAPAGIDCAHGGAAACNRAGGGSTGADEEAGVLLYPVMRQSGGNMEPVVLHGRIRPALPRRTRNLHVPHAGRGPRDNVGALCSGYQQGAV